MAKTDEEGFPRLYAAASLKHEDFERTADFVGGDFPWSCAVFHMTMIRLASPKAARVGDQPAAPERMWWPFGVPPRRGLRGPEQIGNPAYRMVIAVSVCPACLV